jgi:enoyl-CoA hydratase
MSAAEFRQLLAAEQPRGGNGEIVVAERAGDVAVVTLNRPASHNALTLAGWRRVRSIFDELAQDETVRAAVIKGAGNRAFAAGADIDEFPAVRLGAVAAIEYNESVAAALDSVTRTPFPVIGMIRGLAVGGGCELAAACDVRLSDAGARFGIPIGRLGVILGYTEANTLAQLIGTAELKYLLFSGELIDANEAHRLRLVQRVVAPQRLVDETAQLVEAIIAGSEVTMRAAKQVANMCGRPLTAQDTEQLSRLSVEAYGGSDLAEGVTAFQARRPPHFTMKRKASIGRT